MNPIDSITQWVDGVGHHDNTRLYAALTMEETKEILESLGHRNLNVRRDIQAAIEVLDGISFALRHKEGMLSDRLDLLDAALDTAWVALCLAKTLTGDRLAEAWSELHRSNVTAKQVDGKFIKDISGKVMKPDGWSPPNLMPYLRREQQ